MRSDKKRSEPPSPATAPAAPNMAMLLNQANRACKGNHDSDDKMMQAIFLQAHFAHWQQQQLENLNSRKEERSNNSSFQQPATKKQNNNPSPATLAAANLAKTLGLSPAMLLPSAFIMNQPHMMNVNGGGTASTSFSTKGLQEFSQTSKDENDEAAKLQLQQKKSQESLNKLASMMNVTPPKPPGSKAKLHGGRWTVEEDETLRKTVAEQGAKNWKKIAMVAFQGRRTDVQCLHRWQKVLRPGLVKGSWSKLEDQIVKEMVQKHGVGGVKWSVIAAKLPGRLGKQCRERWFNHLDPALKKEPWTEEEDKMLMDAQARLGNKWCQIAALIPGRSENSVKNRWNSAMRRKFQHLKGEKGPDPEKEAERAAKKAAALAKKQERKERKEREKREKQMAAKLQKGSEQKPPLQHQQDDGHAIVAAAAKKKASFTSQNDQFISAGSFFIGRSSKLLQASQEKKLSKEPPLSSKKVSSKSSKAARTSRSSGSSKPPPPPTSNAMDVFWPEIGSGLDFSLLDDSEKSKAKVTDFTLASPSLKLSASLHHDEDHLEMDFFSSAATGGGDVAKIDPTSTISGADESLLEDLSFLNMPVDFADGKKYRSAHESTFDQICDDLFPVEMMKNLD